MEVIQILIVDDHPVVREGLVAMLSTQSDMQVVGEAGTAEEAIAQVARLKPDIVLMDLELPDSDGPRAIRRVRSILPDAKVIVLTAYDTDDRVLSAASAGVHGYLLKGIPRENLFAAIRMVYQGGFLWQPSGSARLLSPTPQESATNPNALHLLTGRELQVLTLMAAGARNKEIAARLSIGERTVKFHVTTILQKLQVNSRTEAVAQALQRGLVKPS